jgi:hypothetical protein
MSKRLHIPALLGASLAAALLAGCGTSTTTSSSTHFTGAQGAVADAISSFQSAAKNRDATKLCNQILAPALAAKLKDSGGGCKHVVGNQVNTVSNYTLTIESISPANPTTTASARVKSISNGKDHFDTLLLTKVGNGWRLSGLGN